MIFTKSKITMLLRQNTRTYIVPYNNHCTVMYFHKGYGMVAVYRTTTIVRFCIFTKAMVWLLYIVQQPSYGSVFSQRLWYDCCIQYNNHRTVLYFHKSYAMVAVYSATTIARFCIFTKAMRWLLYTVQQPSYGSVFSQKLCDG